MLSPDSSKPFKRRLALVAGIALSLISGVAAVAPAAGPSSSLTAPPGNASSLRPVAKRPQPKHAAQAGPVVRNIRVKTYPGYTRLVLDLDQATTFTQSRQQLPARGIVELQNSRLAPGLKARLGRKALPGDVVIAQPHPRSVTVSVNLNRIGDYRLMVLSRPERLVMDLYKKGAPGAGMEEEAAESAGLPPDEAPTEPSPDPAPAEPVPPPPARAQAAPPDPSVPAPAVRLAPRPARDIKVIVIDPGHGGKDPGAIGRLGTAEKDVTLQVGLRLRDLLKKHLGVEVLMTRDRDVFVELGDRAKYANSKEADLFVSIHVNSHPHRNTKGLEVYHFGEASDRRALEVAARENGSPLESTGVGWQYILADFVTSKKIERSQELAWTTKQTMVAHLDDHYDVVDHGVKTAPFYVIRFTAMPSILAEIAFISNPAEERLMRSDAFLTRMADAIFQGIRAYARPLQTAAR